MGDSAIAVTNTADAGLALEMLTNASQAAVFVQPSIGLGMDVWFLSWAVTGSALWANGRYVRICAFAGDGVLTDPKMAVRSSNPEFMGCRVEMDKAIGEGTGPSAERLRAGRIYQPCRWRMSTPLLETTAHICMV